MESHLQRLQINAINAAIANDWPQAISLNREIIKLDNENIDAHLAIGFAYLQSGKLDESIKHYKKASIIEPGNAIARNNLDKIAVLKKKASPNQDADNSSGAHLKEFINVVGKTKIVELVNIGQSEVIANLKVGQQIEVKPRKRRVEARTLDGEYIGALPDDISKRLLFLLDAHSTYLVYIKSAVKNQVEVFLKEEKKGAKVRHFTSFPKNIQDDLKIMMQSLNKDDEDLEDEDETENEMTGNEEEDDKTEVSIVEDEDTEGITDLDALAADLDEEPHDSYITDLSAYDEGDDESEE